MPINNEPKINFKELFYQTSNLNNDQELPSKTAQNPNSTYFEQIAETKTPKERQQIQTAIETMTDAFFSLILQEKITPNEFVEFSSGFYGHASTSNEYQQRHFLKNLSEFSKNISYKGKPSIAPPKRS